LCIFNLSQETAHFNLPDEMLPCITASGANLAAKRNGDMLRLRGYGYFFGNLQPSAPPANSGTAKDVLEDERRQAVADDV
jgi:alpha-glucosidase